MTLPKLVLRVGLALQCVVFVGCATTASNQNLALLSDSREPARSLSEMAATGGTLLPAQHVQKGRLLPTSRPAELDSIRSVYDVYRHDVEKSGRYKVYIDTDCDCFGFNKTVLAPKIVVLGSDGKVVGELGELRPRREGWTTPLGMYGEIRWQAQPGQHTLMIIGSAIRTGPHAVATTTAYVSGDTPMVIGGIPVYGSPFGSYRIELHRLPN